MCIPMLPAKLPNDCLIAAERIRIRMEDLACRVECTEEPLVGPYDRLPIDEFVATTDNGTKNPMIVLKPKRLGNQLWTESVAAYTYAGIERAFTIAGLLTGHSRREYLKELQGLRAWTEEQEGCPDRPVGNVFLHKATRLFRIGILDDRRAERSSVLQNIASFSPSRMSDLMQLKEWIDQDLADGRLKKKGRPTEIQKIVFTAEISNLWNNLTGKPIARGPNTRFARFLVACWHSGFSETTKDISFRHVLRNQIAEMSGPNKCGSCKCCKNGQRCDRIRYFAILPTE